MRSLLFLLVFIPTSLLSQEAPIKMDSISSKRNWTALFIEESKNFNDSSIWTSSLFIGETTLMMQKDGYVNFSCMGGSMYMLDTTGGAFSDFRKYFEVMGKETYELRRKVEIYEKYLGKINGDVDSKCLEILPPKEKPKPCEIPRT